MQLVVPDMKSAKEITTMTKGKTNNQPSTGPASKTEMESVLSFLKEYKSLCEKHQPKGSDQIRLRDMQVPKTQWLSKWVDGRESREYAAAVLRFMASNPFQLRGAAKSNAGADLKRVAVSICAAKERSKNHLEDVMSYAPSPTFFQAVLPIIKGVPGLQEFEFIDAVKVEATEDAAAVDDLLGSDGSFELSFRLNCHKIRDGMEKLLRVANEPDIAGVPVPISKNGRYAVENRVVSEVATHSLGLYKVSPQSVLSNFQSLTQSIALSSSCC
jgi:hypothetical protein